MFNDIFVFYFRRKTFSSFFLFCFFFIFCGCWSSLLLAQVRWEVDCLFVAKLGPQRDKVAIARSIVVATNHTAPDPFYFFQQFSFTDTEDKLTEKKKHIWAIESNYFTCGVKHFVVQFLELFSNPTTKFERIEQYFLVTNYQTT